jgi:hypothetical protein
MKKLVFISGAVVINLVLVLSIISVFNPNNISSEAEWFNGFDITLLFPNSIPGITIFYGGLLSLIIVNNLYLKKIKSL